MKMKKFWAREGVHIPRTPPLDPPLPIIIILQANDIKCKRLRLECENFKNILSLQEQNVEI